MLLRRKTKTSKQISKQEPCGLHVLHRVGSTTLQHVACNGSWSQQPVSWGMMTWGNISPTVGFEPTPLEFRASVLTITPPRLPDVTTLPMPTCLCVSLPQRSVQTATILTEPGHHAHSWSTQACNTPPKTPTHVTFLRPGTCSWRQRHPPSTNQKSPSTGGVES